MFSKEKFFDILIEGYIGGSTMSEEEKEIELEEKETSKEKRDLSSKKITKIEKKMGRKKQYAKVLMKVSFFFLPALVALLIIASHSHELITSKIETVIQFALGFFVGLFLVGLFLYFQNRKGKTKKDSIFYYIVIIIYLLCESFCLVLFYGPDKEFRDWLITTAMATMNHQYYCKWFYSEKEIEEVFSRNYIEGSTDEDLIQPTPEEVPEEEPEEETYANEYEEAVLKREEGTPYKLIQFKVNGCKAYLAIIYDPSKIHVTVTKYIGKWGEYVVDMAKREKALLAINGAGFRDPHHNSSGGEPTGITIVNSKIITNNEYGKPKSGGLIGFTKENKLVLLKNVTAKDALKKGVRDAVSWGPFLIVNGKAAFTKGNGGWGYAARTAIGQRADGIVLFLVVDSNAARTKGASMVDMTNIMKKYGAINAANLDGGTSSVIVENGKLINDPIDSTLSHKTRPIATSFVVKK